MINDKYVDIYISSRNITFYRQKGYDVCVNNFTEVKMCDVNPNSMVKVNVKCDICKIDNKIAFQKYNKSLENGGYYTCRKCSHSKIEKDMKKISIKISKTKRNKFDLITNEIEQIGFLICKKCDNRYSLDNYKKNKNGRYLKTCKNCMLEDYKIYYNNLDVDEKRKRKRIYYKNSIYQNLWRSVLRSYLFRKNKKKVNETIKILGYSSLQLKNHLQSKFDDNMNWENYGTYWQIDHIIPVSLFIDSAPINIVNSLDNLRPLEKNYNLSRGNKIDNEGYKLIDMFQTYIKGDYINNYKKNNI